MIPVLFLATETGMIRPRAREQIGRHNTFSVSKPLIWDATCSVIFSGSNLVKLVIDPGIIA